MTGFALLVAIIAKCEEKIFLTQKNIIWRKQLAKKKSPLKESAHKNATSSVNKLNYLSKISWLVGCVEA